MCSVTWTHPRAGGLVLCFNRDEKHTRPAGLPPCVWGAGSFLAPRDAAGGGTWMAVRRDGVVLALLNHYPAGFSPAAAAPSRGALIPSLAAEEEKLSTITLRPHLRPGMNPFRLLCLMPGDQRAQLFTWDGTMLTQRRLAARHTGFLTSSSWNTAAVLTSRHAVFRQWRKRRPQPSLDDLVAFHRETENPHGAAWAVCMSREDARTVSLDIVHLHEGAAAMTHHHRPHDAPGFACKTHRAELRLTSCSNAS